MDFKDHFKFDHKVLRAQIGSVTDAQIEQYEKDMLSNLELQGGTLMVMEAVGASIGGNPDDISESDWAVRSMWLISQIIEAYRQGLVRVDGDRVEIVPNNTAG